MLAEDGLTAVARAAREGRSDVLELFERRGIRAELRGVDRLVAACAMGDAATVRSIAEREPHAGASVSGVRFPSGYAEVDELLRRHGAKET